jgi:hypothetical protein
MFLFRYIIQITERFYLTSLTFLAFLNAAYCDYELVKISNSVAKELEGSSPHSQQPATGPCPETVESNPHPTSQSA